MIYTKEKAIKKAKKLVIKADGVGVDIGRKWLFGKAPDCFGKPYNSTEIHVLQGSPARGYILDMGAYEFGTLIALNENGDTLGRFEYYPEREKVGVAA